MQSAYDLLGVAEDADAEELTRAYKRQLRALHPDQSQDPQQREELDERCRQVAAAYHTLSDPDKRRAYDEQRRARQGPSPSADRDPATEATEDPVHDPFAEGWRHDRQTASTGGPGNAAPSAGTATETVSPWVGAALGLAVAALQVIARATGVVGSDDPRTMDDWFGSMADGVYATGHELATDPASILVVLALATLLGPWLFARGARGASLLRAGLTAALASMVLLVIEALIVLVVTVVLVVFAGIVGILVVIFMLFAALARD